MKWFEEEEEMPMLLEKQLEKNPNSVSVRQVLYQAPPTSVELILNCTKRTEEKVEILQR